MSVAATCDVARPDWVPQFQVAASSAPTEDASFGQPLVLVRLETIAHEPLDVLDDGRRKLVLASRSRLYDRRW